MKRFFVLIIWVLIGLSLMAKEGMWIPLLVEQYNLEDMKNTGFKLEAEDIYSINQACLKDAVVLFGGGCTGEIISKDGLLITNHHCGFSTIQSHSTVDNDLITNGFWAYRRDEELPNPNLTVSILQRMENVTHKVQDGLDTILNFIEKQNQIEKNIKNIISKIAQNDHLKAEVNSFYFGNEYYLFIYEVFKDVRLVGAPPSSIGKFGGDKDNWVWPRHTGDFTLFRIYADSLNQPADYSQTNIPYKPKKHLAISLRGINEDDFTLIMGYPAFTEEYLTSYALEPMLNENFPKKIDLRNKRMIIIHQGMQSSEIVKLKYVSQYHRISNAWKKWKGVVMGMNRFNGIQKKREEEKNFIDLINENNELKEKYGHILPELKDLYSKYASYKLAYDYGYEAVLASAFISMCRDVGNRLLNGSDTLEKLKEPVVRKIESLYKRIDFNIERKIFPLVLKHYYENIDQEFHPQFFQIIQSKYRGDFNLYTDKMIKRSIFTNEERLINYTKKVNKNSLKKILKDPLFILYQDFANVYAYSILPEIKRLNIQIEMLQKLYIQALWELYPEKLFYPDANHTLRLTYGKVKGYSPADGVKYYYQTTLKGVLEKEDTEIYDYTVSEKLKILYDNKDFGEYRADQTVPVCFTASNHTSGGNSGSPVLNAEGHLIGINFDRNWEGTMSDYMYNPEYCRNISVDIRYVLFIIDKFAGAQNIIDELTIIE